MGLLKDILPDAIVAAGSAIARGGPRRQYKWNKRAANDAYEMNKRIQEEQRAYDAPRAQMDRFLAAGLNPNMIYGGGSGHSGGTFPFSYDVAPPSAQYPDVAGMFLQAGQTRAQTAYSEARTSESYINQELTAIRAEIAKTNPMLQPWVAEWVQSSMMMTARLKVSEAGGWLSSLSPGYSRVMEKINMELEALQQKVGLNTADLAIRNRVLESKEFQNAILEIQSAWLKDAEVTPEHIRQGLMLILQRMIK